MAKFKVGDVVIASAYASLHSARGRMGIVRADERPMPLVRFPGLEGGHYGAGLGGRERFPSNDHWFTAEEDLTVDFHPEVSRVGA